MRAFVEKLRVDLHKKLHSVVDHAVYGSDGISNLSAMGNDAQTYSSDPWSSHKVEQT